MRVLPWGVDQELSKREVRKIVEIFDSQMAAKIKILPGDGPRTDHNV